MILKVNPNNHVICWKLSKQRKSSKLKIGAESIWLCDCELYKCASPDTGKRLFVLRWCVIVYVVLLKILHCVQDDTNGSLSSQIIWPSLTSIPLSLRLIPSSPSREGICAISGKGCFYAVSGQKISQNRPVTTWTEADLAVVSMKFCNDSIIVLLSNLRSQRLEFVCCVFLISPLRYNGNHPEISGLGYFADSRYGTRYKSSWVEGLCP